MNGKHPRIRPRPWAAAGVLASLTGGVLVTAPPAAATSAHVRIAPATADPDYATTLTLSGTGFQSVKGGFGGIYVLFGVVDSNWRPSQGGNSGTDYAYVPDSQNKDNNGFEKFVAFPGSSTLAEANGGVIAADGTWHTTLVVPGARFTGAGTGGGGRKVDCTRERCGVITIGAHGVANSHNETFTPVAFKAPADKAATKPASKPANESAGRPTGDATTKAAAPATTEARAPTTTTPPSTATSPAAAPPGTSPVTPSDGSTAPSAGPVAATLHTSSANGLRVAGLALAAVALVAGGVLAVRRLRRHGAH